MKQNKSQANHWRSHFPLLCVLGLPGKVSVAAESLRCWILLRRHMASFEKPGSGSTLGRASFSQLPKWKWHWPNLSPSSVWVAPLGRYCRKCEKMLCSSCKREAVQTRTKTSLWGIAFCARDSCWSRGRVWEGRSGREKEPWIDCSPNSHSPWAAQGENKEEVGVKLSPRKGAR